MAFTMSVAGSFPRHPAQVNGLLQADAEIIRLPGEPEKYMVFKTDGIHEEIREGLYSDPHLIGWMTVTAPLSDLAAVGAAPMGLLLSLVLPVQQGPDWLEGFKAGIHGACSAYGIYVLGGDTNLGVACSTSATAIAQLESGKPLLRTGIKPGDYLYATARLGAGNAYAYGRLFNPSAAIAYKPFARLQESRFIRQHATACMDTSDGLFPALSVLSELNETGFELTVPLDDVLHPAILPVQQLSGLPAWMFMAGPHGEYELLFSIPALKQPEFLAASRREDWQPVLLGRATMERKLCFLSGSLSVACAPALVPNLFAEAGGNVRAYFSLLLQQQEQWSHP